MIEKYEHHGTEVSVQSHLKGKHREHCLCFSCMKFKQDSPDKCKRAALLFAFCRLNDMVTPVWECPEYKDE